MRFIIHFTGRLFKQLDYGSLVQTFFRRPEGPQLCQVPRRFPEERLEYINPKADLIFIANSKQ
jgi:hypothetical protein